MLAPKDRICCASRLLRAARITNSLCAHLIAAGVTGTLQCTRPSLWGSNVQEHAALRERLNRRPSLTRDQMRRLSHDGKYAAPMHITKSPASRRTLSA